MSETERAPSERYRRMESELRAAREELAGQVVEAVSGEGEVRVVMSGTQVCEKVMIKVADVDADSARRIEKLVREAVNRAIQDSQELAARRLRPLQAEDS